MQQLDLNQQVAAIADELVRSRATPRATYRLQFTRDFTFQDARALVPYLDDLGISHVYASPLLRAVPGSMHGYDICDHSALNPELGSPEDFDAFVGALHERGMGLIVDIVPNHMGITHDCNRWWMDVLENGPGSEYAAYFDVDWRPVKPELENRVLLPILEDQYGDVLESGKLQLGYAGGAFELIYADRHLPISPGTYRLILADPSDALVEKLGEDDEHVQELLSILTALNYLPGRVDQDAEKRAERRREKEVIKRRIATLVDGSPDVRAALEDTLAQINGTPGDARSFDRLDELVEAQAYRVAFWRVAAEEINYRRFFDINGMAAIRVEVPAVFRDTHALILDLLADGKVDGLRIDHPDGLWDPTDYFARLQSTYVARVAARRLNGADDDALMEAAVTWLRARPLDAPLPLYVIVEKILSEAEPLPRTWTVEGTTGYDFVNQVGGIFVNPSGEGALNALFNRVAGEVPPFQQLEYLSKRTIMQESLAGELNALAHQLERLSEKNRHTRDFTLNGLRAAIREVIACMAIYRTYIAGGGHVDERDVRYVEAAVRDARRRNPQTSQTIFNFLRDTLLLRNRDQFAEEIRPELVAFVMKFQQVTSPVMAKSVEDTAFYIFNRLVSLNEVGGSPGVFGTSVEDFHRDNLRRRRQWPNAMVATSTHDTKRGEDVRARLNVLSELPDEWSAAVERWRALNAAHKSSVDGSPAPDSNDEYLLYQTLIGALPVRLDSSADWDAFEERIAAYMAKATHEAKVHTSWTNADEAYDTAVADFVAALLDGGEDNPFVRDFLPFQRRAAFYGVFNALGQTLLKLTAPGVPDTYRGAEMWDFSLVDPDNRRPVDFDLRRRCLDDFAQRAEQPNYDAAAFARELLETADDGRLKLYVLEIVLAHRRAHSDVFSAGDYTPLAATGAQADHVCAYARTVGDDGLIVVVPRLVAGLTGGVERPPTGADVWGDTTIQLPQGQPHGAYRDLFTGARVTAADGELSLAAILADFPVALLVPDGA